MEKKFPQALTYFKEGFSLMPEHAKSSPATLYFAAQTYFQNEDIEFTRKMLHYLINLYPENQSYTPQGFALLGDIYRNKKNFEVALNIYQQVIEKYPHSLGALISKIRMADITLLL